MGNSIKEKMEELRRDVDTKIKDAKSKSGKTIKIQNVTGRRAKRKQRQENRLKNIAKSLKCLEEQLHQTKDGIKQLHTKFIDGIKQLHTKKKKIVAEIRQLLKRY